MQPIKTRLYLYVYSIFVCGNSYIYMKPSAEKKGAHSRKLLCKIYIHVMQKYNTTLQICTTYFLLSMFCFFFRCCCCSGYIACIWLARGLDFVIGHNHILFPSLCSLSRHTSRYDNDDMIILKGRNFCNLRTVYNSFCVVQNVSMK